MAKQFEIVIKILGIGDSNVGKTCLICKYAEDDFYHESGSTIGIDFKIRKMELDGVKLKVQLWDTAGQERYLTITKQYFRRAEGIFIVFDITNEKSFRNLQKWIDIVRECAPGDAELLLIGNKTDKESSGLRVISTEQAQKLAKQLEMPFIETSAKNGFNVDEAINSLARRILEKHKIRNEHQKLQEQEQQENQEFVSELLKKQDRPSAGCC